MLDDTPWPPREEPPEDPRDYEDHLWAHDRDVCVRCGVTGAAYLAFGVSCNQEAARWANAEMAKVRARFKRGAF